MTHYEFARDVLRTVNKGLDEDQHIVCGAMGLAGEAGEFIDSIKKIYFQGHKYDGEKIIDELGDVLFYFTYLLESLGIRIEDVMEYNVAKRAKRYPYGFEIERSVNRTENKKVEGCENV